ncbi:DUF1850 domain-containing protein [Brevibacillus migulae]|uniref:DUF1850 domain-containing protein n=1 Tax=Brevibacillus migulae TaxID=1644114 RepID=UPI00106DD94A|nr:DUF1850 domain-containing protein [Brevibacillus migulae]
MLSIVGAAKGRTTFRLFSFLVVAAALLLFLQIPLSTSLVIRDTRSQQIVWSHSIKNGDSFAIRFIHSIHRTPIVEYYLIKQEQIQLHQMTFEEYGIGMESQLAPGEQLLIEDGDFRVVNMNRLFPALHLFIGQVRANHTLLFEGKEIPFRTLDKPGSAVTIQVEKQSTWEKLGGWL